MICSEMFRGGISEIVEFPQRTCSPNVRDALQTLHIRLAKSLPRPRAHHDRHPPPRLVRCLITPAAAALATALPALSRLARLSLRGSRLGAPGGAEVCAAVGRLAALRELDLSDGAMARSQHWDDPEAEAAAVASAVAALAPLSGLSILCLGWAALRVHSPCRAER
jgi:hypothetical protein